MNLKCPMCARVVAVADAQAGKKATCPHCRQVFSVPPLPGAAPPAATPAKLTPPSPAPPVVPPRAMPAAREPMPSPRPPSLAPPSRRLFRRSSPPRAGILEASAPSAPGLAAPAPLAPTLAPPVLLPLGRQGPALWQHPTLYGGIALALGLVAFPVAAVFAFDYAGLALAGLAIVVALAGVVIYFLYRLASPQLCLVAVLLGAAILFGLTRDMKRGDLARQAGSAADLLTEAQHLRDKAAELDKDAAKKKKEAEDARNEAEDKLKQAEEKLAKVETAPKKVLEEAKGKEKQAQETLGQAEKLKKAAEQEKDAALAKEKEVKAQEDKLKLQEEQLDKDKKALDDAMAKLKLEKDAIAKEQDKAKEILEKAKDAQKKAEDAQRKAEDAVKMLTLKLTDPDPKMQLKATQALANLGSDAPPPVAYALCEVMMYSDKKIRDEALLALHKVRIDLFVPVKSLVLATQFQQDGVSPGVADACKKLGERGKDAAAATPIFIGFLDIFISLKTHTAADVETAKYLTTALGQVAGNNTAAVTALGKVSLYNINTPKDGEDVLRQTARAALQQIGKADAKLRQQVATLLTLGLKEKKAEDRKQICAWLGEFGTAAKLSAPQLTELATNDPDAAVKDAAAKALSAVGN